jgi:hypothetical protein
MKTKHKHIKHHTKAVKGKNQLLLLGIAIVVLAVGVGALTYYKQHRPVTTAAGPLSTHFTDDHGNTFDSQPFSDSQTVQQLVLSGGQILQYFENASDTGILYKIDQTPIQVQQSYLKQFASTGWAIPLNFPITPNAFYFSNSSTKQFAKISLIALPNGGGSSVVIGLQK